ncbi:hypothetical protein M446_4012 [Methylobacterium sp. 4-46]|nr:hypothetical protein M446_4012 [Methylobacterium sp. 4-46]
MLSVRWRPRLEHALVVRGLEDADQQPSSGLVLQQPAAELAQDAGIEAGIGEVEGQQVFPVNPGSDRLSGLAVAQAFAELQEGDEGQAPGCVRGLAAAGKEVSERSIGEDGAQAGA